MSLGDFFVVDPVGERPIARRYQTKAAGTQIKAGEWVIQGTSGDVEYVTVIADTADSDDVWVGVAASTSTETASADGEVFVYDDPSYVFRGKPTTAANLATTLLNTQVTVDVTSSVQTIDENDTTKGTLMIVGYDDDNDTIDVKMTALDHLSQ